MIYEVKVIHQAFLRRRAAGMHREVREERIAMRPPCSNASHVSHGLSPFPEPSPLPY